MAYDQTNGEPPLQFEHHHHHHHHNEDATLKKKYKSPLTGKAPENLNGCLDCNICLDAAQDPVVTLCGHLYCWSCIYKWLHVGGNNNSSSFESAEEPKCPVCKSIISQALLVPLYGRGVTTSESDVKIIPRRPPALELDAMVTAATSITSRSTQPHPPHLHLPHSSDESYPSGPTVGSVGGMVLSRMFLSSDTSLFAYPSSSQNTYPLVGYGSPRMRRQDMLVAKSLNRVTIFLLCGVVLCLVLF